MSLSHLERRAKSDGIAPLDAVRNEIIAKRNQQMADSDFDSAVLLSHAIWWLSSLKEEMELWS